MYYTHVVLHTSWILSSRRLVRRPTIYYTASYDGRDAPPPPSTSSRPRSWTRSGSSDEASVREVMDALNRAAPKPRAYTTYMTILGRLHGKGLLTRRREGKTDVYRPVHTRAEYADLRAQAEVAALVDDVRRRRARPLRPPGRRPRPRAPRSPRAARPWPLTRTARPRPWGLYRLQLALGAAGLARVRARARGRPSARCTSQPAAAHRLDVAGGALHLPGGQRRRRRAHGARRARRRRPASSRCAPRWRQVPRPPPARARAARSPAPLPGHPTVARDRRRGADGVLRRLAAPARVRLDRRARPPLERRAAGRARPRAAPRRAARPAAPRGQPGALPGAVLPPGAAPAPRPLRRRGRDHAPTRPRSRPRAARPVRWPRRCSRSAATPAGGVVGISPARVDSLLGTRRRRGGLPRLLLVAALATLGGVVALVVARERHAPVQATLNLPIASSQPCVLVLALVPVLVCLAAAVARRPALGRRTRRLTAAPPARLRPRAGRSRSQLDAIYYVCSMTLRSR